jgi:hypothetical protein
VFAEDRVEYASLLPEKAAQEPDLRLDQEITQQIQGEQCPPPAFMESKSFFFFCFYS